MNPSSRALVDSVGSRLRRSAVAVMVLSVFAASNVDAARLDCGQPSSIGDSPVATDALFVLRAAVGLASCDVCLCDADGSGLVVASDALGVLKFAIGQPIALACPACPIPSITIDSPAPLTAFADDSVDVVGSVVNASSVTCNGQTANINGNGFSRRVSLREGANVIACVAIGPVGHANAATVSVTVDYTEPSITILSPIDGYVSTTPTVDIAGSVRDLVVGAVGPDEITVMVDDIEAQVSNGSFLAVGVPLQEGFNYPDVYATDRVGNQGYAFVEIIYDPVVDQKTVRAVSGSGQTGAISTMLAQPLVAELLDDAGQPLVGEIVTFRVVQGDGTLDGKRSVARTTDGSGRASATLQLGTHAGVGNQRVEARATGVVDPATFVAGATAGVPAKLLVDSGNNQTGNAGKALPAPLSVVVTDAGDNRLAGVPVTFRVVAGGGSLAGSSELVTPTDADGRAHATMILGAQTGLENNRVEAVFSDSDFPATFVASALSGNDPSLTSVSGVVVDNSNIPVPGVTVRNAPDGTTAMTDSEGQFLLAPVSPGQILLQIDGTTASREGEWPIIDFEMVTVAGVDNDLGRPVYLVRLDRGSSVFVSRTQGGTITLDDYPGFSLTIPADSARFPDGRRDGFVTVTYVHTDKVPMTPNLGQQPDFVVTIQPPGTHFDPPAPVTFPNVAGLPPGRVLELMSFDHDVGRFVSIGTGSVTRDGTTIASDPGVGIIKGGWHATPGQPPTGAAEPVFVRIVPNQNLELRVGDTMMLEADGTPAPGAYSWSSDDASIVGINSQVSSGGTSHAEIEGLDLGTTEVRATYTASSGADATDTVEVNVLPVVHLRPGIVGSLSLPATRQLEVQIEDAGGGLTDVTSDPDTVYEWIGAAGDFDLLRDTRVASLVNTALNKLVDKLGQDFEIADISIDSSGELTISSPGFQVIRAKHKDGPSNVSVVLAGMELKSLDLKAAVSLDLLAVPRSLLALLNESLITNVPLVLSTDFEPWISDDGWLRVENVKFEFLGQFVIDYDDLFDAVEPLIKQVAVAVVPAPLVTVFIDAARETGKFAATQFVDFETNDDGVVATVGSSFGVAGRTLARNPGLSVATGTLDLSSFGFGKKKSDSVFIIVLPRIDNAELRPKEAILHVDDPPEPGSPVRAYAEVTLINSATIDAPSSFETADDFLEKVLPGGLERWINGIINQTFTSGDFQLEVKGRYAVSGDTIQLSPPGISFAYFLPTSFVDFETVDESIAEVEKSLLAAFTFDAHAVHKRRVGQTLLSLTTRTGSFGERLLDVGKIIVTAAQIESLEVEPDSASVEVGCVRLYRAYANFDDGTRTEVTGSATWSSGDDAIAFVGPFGFARGVAPGQTTIEAEYEGFSDTAEVHVAGLVSLEISPPSETTVVGDHVQYQATGTFSDGSSSDVTDIVSWSSDDDGVAYIDVRGEATAAGAGTTTIRASKDGVSDTATIEVLSFDSIDIAPTVVSGCVGDQIFFVATANRSDNSTFDVTTAVDWLSSDTAVAAVAPGGVATLVGDGTAEITATLGDETSNVVSMTATDFDAIRIVPSSATLLVGEKEKFVALRSCSGALGGLLDGVSWQSSATGVGGIAADGTFSGNNAGQSLVTASKDGLTSNAAPVDVLAQSPLGGAILVISEVVEEPVQDWDDSSGGDGIPFNGVVGTAAPDPIGDQWIEIFNASPTATTGLNGFVLAYTDTVGMPATYTLSGAIPPGGYLVVTGAALGGMAVDSEIELRHSSGLVLDSVDMGTLRNLVGPAGTVNGEGMALQKIPTQVPQDWARVRATIAAVNATP